jgi:signal transduction histidine kinase
MENERLNIYVLIIVGMFISLFMGGTVILFYMRYQKRLAAQQQKIMAEELRHQKELLEAVVESQENERKRIGKDLHDDVGNILLNIKTLFNRIEEDHAAATDKTSTINSFIDDAIGQVRTISHKLSPSTLEYFGCNDALEELFQKVHSASGINFVLQNMDNDGLKNLPYETSLHLYRVFEELLSNTLKHAGASEIKIEFEYMNNTLGISYKDNGKGYDPGNYKHGIGLHNIYSRISLTGGMYEVKYLPGSGTTFVLTIPIQSDSIKHIENEQNQTSNY